MAGPYIDYNREFDPWSRAGANIGQILSNSPRLRAMQAQQQAQRDFMAARTDYTRAQTGKVSAQTDALRSEAADSADLEQSFGAVMEAFQKGGDATPALTRVAGKFGRYMQKHPEQTVAALRSLASAGMLNQFGTNLTSGRLEQAAAMEDSNKAYATVNRGEVQANKPTVAGPGSAVLPPGYMKDRTEPFRNPSAAGANAAANVMDTVTEKIDAVPDRPAVPESTTGSLWWKKKTPAQEAQPGHGEIHITRKVPRGSDMSELAKAGLRGGQPVSQPPSAPAGTPGGAPIALPVGQAAPPPTNAPLPASVVFPSTSQAPTNAPAAAAPNPDELIAQANDAIRRGADPVKVKARLAQMGIEVR